MTNGDFLRELFSQAGLNPAVVVDRKIEVIRKFFACELPKEDFRVYLEHTICTFQAKGKSSFNDHAFQLSNTDAALTSLCSPSALQYFRKRKFTKTRGKQGDAAQPELRGALDVPEGMTYTTAWSCD